MRTPKPMQHASSPSLLLQGASCLALLAATLPAIASEGYKTRQSPVGVFGGEMAAPADNVGFFGTASLAVVHITKVVDEDGANIVNPGRTVPLPTGTPTGGAIPNGSYSLVVPTASVDFDQKQTQLNLVGGYLTEEKFANGRIAFAINVPLIKQSRSFVTVTPLGTVTPTPSAVLPATARGAIAAVASAVNAQVQSGVAASVASQNQDVSGLGDTEFSMVWVKHEDRLKVAAGVSVFAPTGVYDKARGPNPGFGNFYTIRPGMAISYSLNRNYTESSWDAGVTVAGRVSFGTNTKNKDTDYRSGNFIYMEGGIIKVAGDWAIGANVLGIQQVSNDSGVGVPASGSRYKNYSAGPFLSYKIPGQDAGLNLHYTQNFASRNALVANVLQLRFITAW